MGDERRFRIADVITVDAAPAPPQPAPDPRPAATRAADAAQFAAIMQLATAIAEQEPAALVDLVALLGRKIQMDGIARLLVQSQPERGGMGMEIGAKQLWFDDRLPLTPSGSTLEDLIVRLPRRRRPRVALRSAVVLPWPWSRERFVDALCSIGPGRARGRWREDRRNHALLCWLPLGLRWVVGGNHSLTAGIAQGRGTVRVEEAYDLAPVYEHVVCNGTSFVRCHDQQVLGPIRSVHGAALFEIGRRMLRHGVSAR